MKKFIILLCFCVLLARDSPPTLEEIQKDPSSTLDEISYYNDRPSLIEEDNERAQKLIKEFGYDKDKVIVKSEYINFLYRLVTIDETLQAQEREFYEKVIDKFVSGFPDEFKSAMIKKYADTEEFNNAVKYVIVDLYGEDAFKEFDSYEVSKEQIDNLNGNNTENNLIHEEEEISQINQNDTTRRTIKSDL